MNTIEEIDAAIIELNKALEDKGWRRPRCEFNADGRYWFKIQADHPIDGGDNIFKYCGGTDSVDDALNEARAKIRSLPSGKEAATDDFRKALAKLIDKGTALGIDADFLNPLTEQMRALSENIIGDNS